MEKTEAIERLEYLKAKAQLALEQEVPEWIAEDVLGTIEAYDMAIEALQTEPKRGEWEEKETFHNGDDDPIIEEWQSARCSVCHKYHTTPYMYYFNNYNFCPNCGADMREREGE